jgi:fructosamine-3-kinase
VSHDASQDASRAVVQEELRALGRGAGVAGLRRLSGGVIADTWLISYADGTSVVGKTLAGAAPGLFRVEADGLAALRATGHLATPAVLAVTGRLLLEALAEVRDTAQAWEAFAR